MSSKGAIAAETIDTTTTTIAPLEASSTRRNMLSPRCVPGTTVRAGAG